MDVRRRIPVKPQDVKNDPGQICEIETDQDDSVALDSDAAQDVEIHAWNKENKLCGWFDAPSSKKGIQEAHAADQTLKRKGYQFDTAHTSVLTRAQHTLKVTIEEIEQSSLPVEKTWRLKWRLRETVYKAMEDVNNKGKPK
ncbi:hypothetical protein QYM36_018855 [Artemia franciscana]|uniref:phosphoglycerate mutase (2,3-diphosphoglycerate-dependent) n=1 Tax=Artemia franciscana TaxID=6661 RepID=A0AA88H629_ARTSF|nr:hypothetical protein QYM36_018855 [Artemia franciscana]